jgi:hypothetical protein
VITPAVERPCSSVFPILSPLIFEKTVRRMPMKLHQTRGSGFESRWLQQNCGAIAQLDRARVSSTLVVAPSQVHPNPKLPNYLPKAERPMRTPEPQALFTSRLSHRFRLLFSFRSFADCDTSATGLSRGREHGYFKYTIAKSGDGFFAVYPAR